MRLAARILDLAGVPSGTLYELADGTELSAWEVCAGWLAEYNANLDHPFGDDADDWDVRRLADDFGDWMVDEATHGRLFEV